MSVAFVTANLSIKENKKNAFAKRLSDSIAYIHTHDPYANSIAQ
jgi:hypothetical protein